MNKYILNSLLLTHLFCFVLYDNDIHYCVRISGISIYAAYIYLYKLSFTNIYFATSITPLNYSEPLHGSHKLVSYGFSTLHALLISLYSTLYLFNIIDNYAIKQVFFLSMNYYLADIFYVSDSTKKLTKLDYFTICHHTIMIMMYYKIFMFIYNDINLENTLLYYINRGLLAEYSVITLNYSWYLVNTKQENCKAMFVSAIITLILYFFTRVINFTRLIYNFWSDNLIYALIILMPLFFINYYWFYKLFCKANRIHKKMISKK
jgi:hypothetical protein